MIPATSDRYYYSISYKIDRARKYGIMWDVMMKLCDRELAINAA